MSDSPPTAGWSHGPLPANVRLGPNSLLTADYAFKRFLTQCDPGLVVGANCTLDGVHFAIGREGRVTIGDYCFFTNAVLLCELELRIGNYVVIGWNATIADTDFHPLAPAERVADALLRRHVERVSSATVAFAFNVVVSALVISLAAWLSRRHAPRAKSIG